MAASLLPQIHRILDTVDESKRRLCDRMHFETIFDVVQTGYDAWAIPPMGLIPVGIGAFALFFPRAARVIILFRASPRTARQFIGFGIIWMVAAFAITYGSYVTARKALLSGDHSVVEGTVTEFAAPTPLAGPVEERFTVTGQKFKYSKLSTGFNKTGAQLIRNGMYVRVTHTGNTILRLEIAR
jgi:hypothetical protein